MFEKILAAKKRLHGHANVTPVHTSRTLNELVGAEVYLKCENFQRIGAFKFRGAFNSISQLSEAEKARGVLTYSSGNHAQAVALVGRLLGVQTTIIMPDNAPATKRAATEGYGATIIEYDPAKQSREDIAKELEAEHGYTLIPPYDHIDVVAGQGTACRRGVVSLASNLSLPMMRQSLFIPKNFTPFIIRLPSLMEPVRHHWGKLRFP